MVHVLCNIAPSTFFVPVFTPRAFIVHPQIPLLFYALVTSDTETKTEMRWLDLLATLA